MKVRETDIKDLCIFEHEITSDNRGDFVKIYRSESISGLKSHERFRECFYTVSKKGVIRGMHFQLPPNGQDKLVTVVTGEIEDVVIDLRRDSPTSLRIFSIAMSSSSGLSVYVPVGFAHGFKTLEERTTVLYLTSSIYHPESDSGIRYNSFGYDWKIDEPILSERDLNLPMLEDFKTPFQMV